METPIQQAIKWCEEHINYRSRSTKSQQEKEIFSKVKEKLESLLPIEVQFAEYNKSLGKNMTSKLPEDES
jgi:preprotein translocase subunit Sec63